MSELSKESVLELSSQLKIIVEAVEKIEVSTLEEAYEKMRSQHSFRESAMVLSPNPFTAIDVSNLEASKLKTMKLILELRKNRDEVKQLTMLLAVAKSNESKLGEIFGM